MAEDKSSSTGITAKEFGRRFRKALSVPFLLNNVCSTNVTEFVNAYATSLGCSEKTFFFPLLTCAAACMGTNCYIELSSLWREPPIVWTLVITPRSLLRIDVAEHLKNVLLNVQQDLWTEARQDDTKDHLKRFIFDLFSLDQLQEMLKLSKGHGCGIYNSIRTLHKCMTSPDDTDIMHRLHYGLGWFADSRVTRSTLTSTRVNLSIISTPPVVQQTLNTALSFHELFYQCFLTVCAEENYVKFGELCTPPETEKLKEILFSIMKLHSSKSIVYKLSAEACEKFGQIHDELTDKAKQMVRKNIDHKVFQPALSYLGRLSCILHVLDNMIESIKYKVPITPLTWNTEINAATVWHARELLGHIVEQRHALMEPTTIVSVQKVQRIDLVDGQESTSRLPQTPQLAANVSPVASNPHASPGVAALRRPVNIMNSPRSPRVVSVRRNLMNNIATQQVNNQFDALLNNNNNNSNNNLPVVTPCITSVSSAGIPVANKAAVTGRQNTPVNTGFNLPQSLSVSVSDDVDNPPQPCLLSRTPYTSILDLSNEDFLRTHKSSIQKILVHGVSPISPSRCVQLKLIFDPTATDNTQKYSLSFARTFLKKLEKMQFGVCEGPKNGNLRHFLFKKKKFSALTNDQIKLLCDLGINEKDYSKCFNLSMRGNTQNGSVVCLE